jgi:hypothetical protein
VVEFGKRRRIEGIEPKPMVLGEISLSAVTNPATIMGVQADGPDAALDLDL